MFWVQLRFFEKMTASRQVPSLRRRSRDFGDDERSGRPRPPSRAAERGRARGHTPGGGDRHPPGGGDRHTAGRGDRHTTVAANRHQCSETRDSGASRTDRRGGCRDCPAALGRQKGPPNERDSAEFEGAAPPAARLATQAISRCPHITASLAANAEERTAGGPPYVRIPRGSCFGGEDPLATARPETAAPSQKQGCARELCRLSQGWPPVRFMAPASRQVGDGPRRLCR